jgi:hypothetical protein
VLFYSGFQFFCLLPSVERKKFFLRCAESILHLESLQHSRVEIYVLSGVYPHHHQKDGHTSLPTQFVDFVFKVLLFAGQLIKINFPPFQR